MGWLGGQFRLVARCRERFGSARVPSEAVVVQGPTVERERFPASALAV